MSGFEVRVNGELVRFVAFDENDGGVLGVIVEWVVLREHEICWLVDLPTPFKEVFPGDEIYIRVVEGSLPPSQSDSTKSVSYRLLPSRPRELGIDVRVNGQVVRQVRGSRMVDAHVMWVKPTPEMQERGVQPSLRVTSASGSGDIEYAEAAPGDEIVFTLLELPVAVAESGYAEESVARGAA
jgi:hypothetical protein